MDSMIRIHAKDVKVGDKYFPQENLMNGQEVSYVKTTDGRTVIKTMDDSSAFEMAATDIVMVLIAS